MIAWIRQWLYMRRVLRGYKKAISECKKINRVLDRIERERGI
jgi:hypothetical protein